MCIKPFSVKLKDRIVQVPCKRCLGCRISYLQDILFLSQCEQVAAYEKGLGCSFVTLTYSDDFVPFVYDDYDNKFRMTLRRKQFTDFMKRMRINLQRSDFPLKHFRFIACGEYGDGSHNNGIPSDRPHYHAVFFGLSQGIADRLVFKSWKFGFSQVGSLRAGGLSYVCKYITKSKLDTDDSLLVYGSTKREKPFFRRSQYLGREWIEKNIPDNSCFYGGSFIPATARKILGISSDECVSRLKAHAISEGYKDLQEYSDKLKADYQKILLSKARLNLEPVSKNSL